MNNTIRTLMTKALILCHLAMCSLLSPLIMSFGHVFTFVTTYVIWTYVPFCHHLLCDLVMCSFCHYLLCHLVICSLFSPLIMSSGHVFPFVTTYYVIWSHVPFLSPFIMSSGHVFPFVTTYYVLRSCFLLSLLIMLSGHMFPFCHHLLCHLDMCSLLSPLIMYSGHMFPFVTTCKVAIYHVTSCKHLSLLLCQVAICYATFKSYEVMWPYATLSYAALTTFIMSSGHMLCYLSSSLFIYNWIEIVMCIWYTGKLYIWKKYDLLRPLNQLEVSCKLAERCSNPSSFWS